MLNLYKLEVFNIVAEEGSFSRAAEKLLLTQPAVSQHVRDLESGLGARLFKRSSRGVILTPAGELLQNYSRCILRMVVEAESAVANLGQRAYGPLALGATPGVGVYLLPRWLQSFQQRFPEVSSHLHTGTTTELSAGVTEGRLDLAFVEGEISAGPPLSVLALREIELYVVVGEGHPWWEREEISLAELSRQPFIARPQGSQTRAWTDQLFARQGIAPQMVAEFDNPEAIKRAVAGGMGISILPDWALVDSKAAGLSGVPIRGIDLRRTLKLLRSERTPLKPAAQAFLAHLSGDFPALAQLSFQEPGPREQRPDSNCEGRNLSHTG